LEAPWLAGLNTSSSGSGCWRCMCWWLRDFTQREVAVTFIPATCWWQLDILVLVLHLWRLLATTGLGEGWFGAAGTTELWRRNGFSNR
jgi:hypothetical protein